MTFQELMQYGLLAFKTGEVDSEGVLIQNIGYTILCVLACVLIGYFIGSLNFGVIISKFYGQDIREKGSGNAGATNMMRVYGKKASILTLVCDILKTIIAVFAARLLVFGYLGAYITGLFVMIGHAWPVYFNFRGGKGVAAIAAFCLVTEPIVFLIELALFLIILFAFKMVSLGSVMIAMTYPFVLSLIRGAGLHVIIAILMGALVIFLHRKNLVRIFNHTENKFKFGKKKKPKQEDVIETTASEPSNESTLSVEKEENNK